MGCMWVGAWVWFTSVVADIFLHLFFDLLVLHVVKHLTATCSVIRSLKQEASICMELNDYYAFRTEPSPLVAILKQNRLMFKKKRRELRRIKLNLLDLDEIKEEEGEINMNDYQAIVETKVKGEISIRRYVMLRQLRQRILRQLRHTHTHTHTYTHTGWQ